VHQHNKFKNLRLGFIGLGKYGYTIMKAILKSGHHNINNIYFEKIDEKILKDLTIAKQNEIKNNYENLRKLLVRFKEEESIETFFESHSLSIKGLIEELTRDNEGCTGALIISLDLQRWERIVEKIANIGNKINWKNVWILSSISRLEIEKITNTINKNVRIIRYIPNLATGVGKGIISAYIEPASREEGEVIIKRVFQGLGKIILVDKEDFIDSARIITGSTIGLFSYFAKILSDSIRELSIENLGKTQEEADEIVYHSIAGMLALCRQNEIESWDKLSKTLQVIPGMGEKLGIIKFITNNLDNKNLPNIIKDSIKSCYQEYLSDNSKIEI